MARIFVSGANGFIGRALISRLQHEGHEVIGGLRSPALLPSGVTPLITGDLADSVPALSGVDVVIHTAGLAHQKASDLATMTRNNAKTAEKLALATPNNARFIYLSSIGVHGRSCPEPITELTPPAPIDDYARSKLVAEDILAKEIGPRLHIVRPTAVIGPGCPGNISSLIKVLQKGLPLPFGAIRNARSFIDVDDLTYLIAMLVTGDAPRLVLAAHPVPISTPDLIRALAQGLNRPARLLPVPLAWLGLAARATGKDRMWESLSGTLIVRPAAATQLGWQPTRSLVTSFIKTAAAV